jgi:primosomal protein N' (replication factor Y)
MLTTQSLFESPFWEDSAYDTVAVLGCEDMLGAFDFRATERTFARLLRLLSLAKKQLLIQTQVTDNSALAYLQKIDIEGFYAQELKQREELSLPPSICLGTIFVRSIDQLKAKNSVQKIFKNLKKGKITGLDFFEPVACTPFKVRGNYRFQILVKYGTLELIDKKLRKIIENPTHGVIVTFDPSPL